MDMYKNWARKREKETYKTRSMVGAVIELSVSLNHFVYDFADVAEP